MNFNEPCECGKAYWEHATFKGFEDVALKKGFSGEEAAGADGHKACAAFRRRLTPGERQDVLADIMKIRESLC